MSLATDAAILAVLGGVAYFAVQKLGSMSVANAAAAVDQRNTDSALGTVQSAVSGAVEKMEALIRQSQAPKPVQVRQYSFDASKWGD